MNGRLVARTRLQVLTILLVPLLLAALTLQPAFAAPPVSVAAGVPARTITVQALIDGKSQLILRGNTARWLNIDFAAPGRWSYQDLPTTINGKAWFPSWPDVTDSQNYSCNCYSSTFKAVAPPLPQAESTVEVNVVQGRGPVTVVQAPAAANDYTLILEFDDDLFDGATTYEVQLIVTPRDQRTISVAADIDGRSRLILHGNTAQWFHLDFAAPGRLEFSNDPTVINGKQWFPAWPDVPDAENRDCSCYSSVFRGLTPAIPHRDMAATLTVLEGRGQVSLVQQPDASNDYSLIVEFDDDPQGGEALYRIELHLDFKP